MIGSCLKVKYFTVASLPTLDFKLICTAAHVQRTSARYDEVLPYVHMQCMLYQISLLLHYCRAICPLNPCHLPVTVSQCLCALVFFVLRDCCKFITVSKFQLPKSCKSNFDNVIYVLLAIRLAQNITFDHKNFIISFSEASFDIIFVLSIFKKHVNILSTNI